MKSFISIAGFLALSVIIISTSCTNPVKGTEETPKVENTLQSVSYLKDTVGYSNQQLIDVFNTMNEIIDSIGYPDAGYKLWQIQEDSSGIRYMIEGFWPDQQTYDKVHNHRLYRETWNNEGLSLEGLVSVEYHRFTKL